MVPGLEVLGCKPGVSVGGGWKERLSDPEMAPIRMPSPKAFRLPPPQCPGFGGDSDGALRPPGWAFRSCWIMLGSCDRPHAPAAPAQRVVSPALPKLGSPDASGCSAHKGPSDRSWNGRSRRLLDFFTERSSVFLNLLKRLCLPDLSLNVVYSERSSLTAQLATQSL